MRMLTVIHAMLGALNFGAAYAHVLEMRPKRAMSGQGWLTTQWAYRDFGRVAGSLIPVSVTFSLGCAFKARRNPVTALLLCLHAAFTLSTVVVWAKANKPVNLDFFNWDPADLPPDWEQKRDQWELGHALSAGLHLIGFSVPITALTQEDD